MAAMITAFVVVVGGGQISAGTYIDSFVGLSQPMDFVLAEFKAFIFGFVATIVAAHKGLSARGGPKGVADAVNQSVVLTFLLLFSTNIAMTQAYLLIAPPQVV
jgi:phospholipid/cholesterol/gamma-HCH transport system permease protein